MSDLGKLVAEARARAAQGDLPPVPSALVEIEVLDEVVSDDTVATPAGRARDQGFAAICVGERALAPLREALDSSSVRLAAVVNYPEAGEDVAAVAEQAARAVGEGAQEIDVWAPRDTLAEGDVETIGELVDACRLAAGPAALVKLMIDGEAVSPPLLTGAARAAVMAGVDFLGLTAPSSGSALENAAILLTACLEAGGRVGFKLSSRDPDERRATLAIAQQLLGAGWVTPAHLRLAQASVPKGDAHAVD